MPSDSSIVLTVNAIQARKGLHTLIKAARIVMRGTPDAYSVIVGRVDRGAGWYATYIKRLIEKSGLDAHFKFTGFVSKQELPLFMSACDVFTLTSYAEGAPLVIPEAMACSRTVIATQGAAADYLPANLIVQNGDYNGLAQRISYYLSNMRDCESCGKELRREAVNKFSWTNIAKRTCDLYKECRYLD